MWHEAMPVEYRDAILTGDARLLAEAIPPESVDLIFTDPPYHKEHLPLYGWLAELGARALKPDGFLLVYAGGYYKDRIMAMLGQRMDYFWDYTVRMGGNSSVVWERKTIAGAKSVLAYRKRGSRALPRTMTLGFWGGGCQDKRFHIWGQDESAARYYIDCFTTPGDVVCDPFLGGGTTAAMAKVLGRHYVAFELDADTAERARRRVANTQPALTGFAELAEQGVLDL